MKQRKKGILDGIDREILRLLYKRRPLVGRQIAKKVGLTPTAISPRLKNLKKFGILRDIKKSKVRKFQRTFGTKVRRIRSYRSIYWDLDLVKK